MRLVFIGTGDIGLPALEGLIGSGEHRLEAVVTQPDKPAGRRQRLTPSPVKVRALAAGVPVLQPARIGEAVEVLRGLAADVFVVAAYGQILPRRVLELPRRACLNIHASLLPRHRGASPVQAAVREGDAETGITIMWMDEGLDTGDILLAGKVAISPEETGGSLHDRLAALAPACLGRALALIGEGRAPRAPQDSARATLTRKLGREDGRIDWGGSAVAIERLVRAYDPWPGTHCLAPLGGGEAAQLKVHRARVRDAADGAVAGGAGTIVEAAGALRVACGVGILELLEVQLQGGLRMAAADFLRGHPLAAGTRLH